MGKIHIVFDGPPEHVAGRFVEVEDENGHGMKLGEWEQHGDYWHLVFDDKRAAEQQAATLRAEVERLRQMIEEADLGLQKVEGKDGFIAYYVMQPGPWHRLLALARGGGAR